MSFAYENIGNKQWIFWTFENDVEKVAIYYRFSEFYSILFKSHWYMGEFGRGIAYGIQDDYIQISNDFKRQTKLKLSLITLHNKI